MRADGVDDAEGSGGDGRGHSAIVSGDDDRKIAGLEEALDHTG